MLIHVQTPLETTLTGLLLNPYMAVAGVALVLLLIIWPSRRRYLSTSTSTTESRRSRKLRRLFACER